MDAISWLGTFSATHEWIPLVVFIAVRALSVIYPPFPGFPVDLLGIRIYGATFGFLLAEIGIMLGASVAFFAGRLARRFVVSSRYLAILTEAMSRRVDHLDEVGQLRLWFVVRLLTNPLFDPLSYAAGLTRSRFRAFFLGSLLGNIPSMALFYGLEMGAVRVGAWAVLFATVAFGLLAWYVGSKWLDVAVPHA